MAGKWAGWKGPVVLLPRQIDWRGNRSDDQMINVVKPGRWRHESRAKADGVLLERLPPGMPLHGLLAMPSSHAARQAPPLAVVGIAVVG